MKKASLGLVFAAGLTGLVAAQEPATGTSGTLGQAAGQAAASRSAMNQITMVGCVQPHASPSAGAVGTAGSTTVQSQDGASYILTNATAGSASSASATGAANAAADAAASATDRARSTYALEGSSNFAAHAGHRVAVTGTLQPATRPAADAGASASRSSSDAGTGAAAAAASTAMPRLQVSSIQMISTDCSSAR